MPFTFNPFTCKFDVVPDTSGFVLKVGDTMTGALGINANSTTALKVEQDGVKDDIMIVDTTNGYIGMGGAPTDSQLQVINNATSTARGITVDNFNASQGAAQNFRRSRNATIGAHTILQDNDPVGVFAGFGSDGDSWEICGSIKFVVDGTPSDGNMPGSIELWTRPAGGANTKRVEIESNGTANFVMTSTETSGEVFPIYCENIASPAGASSAFYRGLIFNATQASTSALTATTASGGLVGIFGSAYLTNTGTVTAGIGAQARVQAYGANNTTLTSGYAFHAGLVNWGGGGTMTVTNFYGLYVAESVGAALTLTNQYGVYVENMTKGGTLNYSIYTGTGRARFGDNVLVAGDTGGGLASTVGLSNVVNESISTGVGSIKMCGGTARTNTGFWKVYNGTGARYVPYFTTITG